MLTFLSSSHLLEFPIFRSLFFGGGLFRLYFKHVGLAALFTTAYVSASACVV